MSKLPLIPVVALAAAISALAFAGTAPTDPPSMKFRVHPVDQKAPATEHAVTPYRINDLIHVVIKDPVRCGQQPSHPSFELQPGKLILRYDLTPAQAGAGNCTVVSEFDIQNVPHEDISVSFSGGGEPLSVAALKKCSFYNPKTADVWECMTPEKQAAKK